MTEPPDEHGSPFDDLQRPDDGVRRRRGRGCLPVLFGLVVVLVLALVAGFWIYGKVQNVVAGPADYTGTGSGRVTVQVREGDSATTIGQTLRKRKVVKSVGAFVDAARKDPKSQGIQVGYYQLKLHMPAAAALKVLDDPGNLVQSTVTVREGARVRDIVGTVARRTDISRSSMVHALSHPGSLGLPATAGGNPEGYLFPATYTVTPGESATKLLRQMVAESAQADRRLDLDGGARRLGLAPEKVVTVASILEYEAKRNQDYPKVARAIYNRLHKGMALQSDATVSYASGVSKQVWTTSRQRSSSSPYNTYQHRGLPPGPIGSPGRQTLHAALHPAHGKWLYWVVVNLRTGRTAFATTLKQHNRQVKQFKKYCRTSSAC
ncbi:MAG: endolytic transglycosylase MltG [Marmoricola sp.]